MCNQTLVKKENANGPGPGGYLAGDLRNYTCIAGYMWDDRNTGDKDTKCQTDGTWTPIAYECMSVLFILPSLISLSFFLSYLLTFFLSFFLSLS